MSFQAYLDGAEKKTGKTPAELLAEAAARGYDGDTKAAEVLDWLKAEYDLGRGHAMPLYQILKHGPEIAAKYDRSENPVPVRLDGIANR
ncbi:DUF4287 domain-containing protein [Lentzea alba]|uniref:DUF4287 domain-containing protein n=1 Tax=Lentzea alba TaxID=2714351 RepID=UPI0039BF4C94